MIATWLVDALYPRQVFRFSLIFSIILLLFKYIGRSPAITLLSPGLHRDKEHQTDHLVLPPDDHKGVVNLPLQLVDGGVSILGGREELLLSQVPAHHHLAKLLVLQLHEQTQVSQVLLSRLQFVLNVF